MALESLRDLFMAELRDLYSAGMQLLKTMPLLARGAGTPLLRRLLQRRLEVTEVHARRLEASFASLAASPRGRHSVSMEGLVEHARVILSERGPACVVDAALIGVLQRIERCQIAAYDSARIYALLLGETEIAEMLAESVYDAEYMDSALTSIASAEVHERAMTGALAVAGAS